MCSSGYFCLLIAFLQWQQFTATLHFPVKLVYPTKCALTNDLIIFKVIFSRGSKVIPDFFAFALLRSVIVQKSSLYAFNQSNGLRKTNRDLEARIDPLTHARRSLAVMDGSYSGS